MEQRKHFGRRSSEKEQARNLLHELERFSRDHYWLRLVTIESMHRHSVARWLKMWLGKKAQIIYIHTANEKRFERALITQEEVISNDRLKKERGIELIRSEADLILDNNDTFADTMRNLLRFAELNKIEG